jgi:hypothetical protein
MPPELGNKNKNKYHYFLCFLLVNENTPHFRDLGTRTPEVFMNAWEQLHLPFMRAMLYNSPIDFLRWLAVWLKLHL